MNQQSNLFTTVKQSVTAWQAASFYGLKPDRSGMCRCPFHNDHTPSLKLYDDHFYCFGCGTSGDVIDLAGKLLSLSPKEAADRLCRDFGIHPDADECRPKTTADTAAVPVLTPTVPDVLSPSVSDGGMLYHRPRDQPISGFLSKEKPSLKGTVNAAFGILLGMQRVTQELMNEHAPKDPEDDWSAVFTFAVDHHARARCLLDVLLFGGCDEQRTFLDEHGPELKLFEDFICWYDRRKEVLYERKLRNRTMYE